MADSSPKSSDESSSTTNSANRLDPSQKELSKEAVEDDIDMEAFIDDLQSEDEHAEEEDLLGDEEEVAFVAPASYLQTDHTIGLPASQVLASRRKFGINAMKEEKQNEFIKFMRFFVGPIPFVMIAAFLLAAGLEDWIDLGVIAGLLLLNAVIGYCQERSAGNAVEELKKGLALKANVLRDGTVSEIKAPDVVIGDIVVLDVGTVLAADGKIMSINGHLQVDQAGITGESMAAEKNVGDTCYGGSTVKAGDAVMMVTAIGDHTFVGRAAFLVNKAEAGTGHFTEVLNGIGLILLTLVMITILVVWIACLIRGVGIKAILVYTLGITIIGVPVGLPAVVTTTMAVGAMFLGKKQAIVQKLSAIESLAGVDVLCSDKTGTLTKNKLILHEPYLVPGIDRNTLIRTACLAASRKKKGIDAIDRVFFKALKGYPEVMTDFTKYEMIKFSPFDPVSKKVQAAVKCPDGTRMICVKGAPSPVLDFCLAQNSLSEEIITGYREEIVAHAKRGFRSLGVARKVGNNDWEILGIVPCFDPPRHDTGRTIQEAKRLGLSIKMLTGDAVGIAMETAGLLGMGKNIYNVDRLSNMPGSKLSDFVENADGFAGVFPEHKYQVVEILQNRGHLVAMTGDGVNDAPSLKKSDTGIAVEGSTDAARSAADIVFLAPGLGAIIDAIKTARQIFHRMHSYIVYRIALSLHLEIFLGLWIAILNNSMSVELIVFIAIFADIATLTIAYDAAPYSKSPVKWNLPKLWAMAVILGMILAAGTWITLATMLANGGKGGIIHNYGVVDEVLFLQIVLTENWLILITRADGPFWSSCPSWQLGGAIFIVDAVATIMAWYGAFKGNERTSPVTLVKVWCLSFGIFCVMALAYRLLDGSSGFDNLINKREKKRRNASEDFALDLKRVATEHEKQDRTNIEETVEETKLD